MDATELSSLLEAPAWDGPTVSRIRREAFASSKHLEQFRSWVRQTAEKDDQPLKVGVGLYLLGEAGRAAEALKKAEAGAARSYFLARAYREAGSCDSALAEFERAESRGWDGFDVAMQQVETLRQAGRRDEAEKLLKRHARAGEQSAEFHYQHGCLRELDSDYMQAAGAYERALQLDAGHQGANFRLAYLHGLKGEEEEAVRLYRKCIESAAAPLNALVNLAVLFEDEGNYDLAIRCLQEVLKVNPNHARARLFMKDSLAGLTQYYDEVQERARDKRTAVLDIPITDFELSVRSRNCLKKMNIHTLGDLLTVTETDLLAYKNFGETSLNEIKAVLTQKGLHLGQANEEEGEAGGLAGLRPAGSDSGPPDILGRSVDELELSVRSRRCLERLGVRTLGELASRTEAELMATKNFGQTSLMEIKQQLAARGLSLRQLDD